MGETVTENELYIIYPTSDPEVSLNSAYKHHLEASEPKWVNSKTKLIQWDYSDCI